MGRPWARRSGHQDLRFEVAGMPFRDQRISWAALVLSVLALVWGGVRVRSAARPGAPAPPAAPVVAVLDAASLSELQDRRKKLFDRLVRLEQEHRADSVDDDAYRRRRDDLKRRLVDVDRRLDG